MAMALDAMGSKKETRTLYEQVIKIEDDLLRQYAEPDRTDGSTADTTSATPHNARRDQRSS